MEKSTTKEDQFSKKVVVVCGPIIRKIRIIKPPTTLIFINGVLGYKRLTNTDDEMAD
uniref:Putative non structural protein n=1 Tax=Infectious bronchitis virus TaxID=11120 RepID=A0A0N9R023_9GAMC|nr:putative non structural protein [Infectious bronchitis virus]